MDMLQALNTGHEGSLGTAHANSCRDMLARLGEIMTLIAELDLPLPGGKGESPLAGRYSGASGTYARSSKNFGSFKKYVRMRMGGSGIQPFINVAG